MKLPKSLLLLAILFVTSQVCFAQEIPKAVLIDEFGKIGCEDLIARQDALISELQNDPTATGYVVIYGDKNEARWSWRIKLFIDGQTFFRRFDATRLLIIKEKDGDDPKVQFWKVPAGAEKPNFDEVGWNYDLSDRKKPFVFYTTENEDGLCPSGHRLKDYSNYLSANSDFRGHIVIFAKSQNQFQKQKSELINDLTKKNNLSSTRLRFFFKYENNEYTQYELWLVPPKK